MIRRYSVIAMGIAIFVAIPAVARAQAVRGTVKDSTGGALPGVTVEAKSDVLIEGSKSTQTDGEGQYTISDLRPGEYTVTFTLQGFQTLINKGVKVTNEETTAVNAELRIGGRGEELTVTGAAATVDVQNATHTTTLERSVLDNLPIGNNIWEMAQMIPAIDMYSDFTHRSSSVSGSFGAVQTYMSVNGQLSSNNVIMVDGMTVSGLEFNGTVQAYFNNDMNNEISYQTTGISADRSGGGVTVNMIPREGGNRFTGDAKLNYRPESWIGNNVGCNTAYTASCAGQDSSVHTRLNAMGLNSSSSLRFLEDETISQGGPIVRNKLWFFGSFHQFRTSDFVANSFFNDGAQATGDQRIRQGSGRLTYQLTPRTKLTGYYDKTQKLDASQFDSFDDPETSRYTQYSPNYATGNVKLTNTFTSRLLLEAGYSMNREWRDQKSNEDLIRERGTPEWYTIMRKTGTGGAVNTFGAASVVKNWPSRDNIQSSLSYVTGAHQVKVGVQWQFGRFYHLNDTNGDLYQNYQVQQKASCPHAGNCTNAELVLDTAGYEYKLTSPSSITAWNTPVQSQDVLNGDVGIYFQDSYRYKRLTVNPGLRWERVNGENDPYKTGEGRWAPTRSINGVRNVPDWFDWAPRFNVVYDIFGNARTAVKYSINRYNQAAATTLANSFNTLSITSRTLSWNDKNGNDTADGSPGFVYDANGKVTDYGAGFYNCASPSGGFTTGYLDPNNPCELNMVVLKNSAGALFGTPAAEQQYQGYPRSWLLDSVLEVQHALSRRLSVTLSWQRTKAEDQTKTVNSARRPDDYVPYKLYNPIDGTPMTFWTPKDVETQTRLSNSGNNVTYVEPLNYNINNSYNVEFRMRPYAGASLFGGVVWQQANYVSCDSSIPGFVVDPNSLRYCDAYHLSQVDDHGIYDSERSGSVMGFQRLGFTAQGPIADQGGANPMPPDFRLGASLPLPWYGINLGVSYLNNDEGTEQPNLTVTVSNAGFSTSTCGGGTTRYTDGLTGCKNAAGGTPAAGDTIVYGTSNTRKIATATAPACPATYGCTPGAMAVLPGFLAPTNTATTVAMNLFPYFRVRRERLNQFDIRVSKTFRVSSVSILPTLEVGNLFNQNKITATATSIFATTGSTYQIPSSILQSRIIGFGAQIRW